MGQVEHFYARDLKAWHNWLKTNHAKEKSVWLVYDKKSALGISEIINEALCWGWVDSKGGSVDEKQSKIYVSQRRPGSTWSRVNKDKIERLIKDNRMQPAGLAKITAAKKDGSWTLLDDVENLVVPTDLQREFAKNKAARDYFATFPPGSKKQILWWIKSAKLQKTRQERIKITVEMAARNIRANQ